MATDIEIVNGVLEPLDIEELETPVEASGPTQGSNLVNLSPVVVNFVLARLRAGRTLREIRKLVKQYHPQHKSISWGQLQLIIQRRRQIYAAKYAAANPEPVEP